MTERNLDQRLHELALAGDGATALDSSSIELSAKMRVRLAELRQTVAALDAARDLRSLDLQAPPTEDEDDLVTSFRANVPAPARRSWTPWVAAAAGLLLTFAGARMLVTPTQETENVANGLPTAPRSLGSSNLSCLTPLGVVESYGEFRWKGSLEPGQSYDLFVVDRAAPDARPIAVGEDLDEEVWIPSEAESAALPDQLTWIVRVRGADGRWTERRTSGAASRR